MSYRDDVVAAVDVAQLLERHATQRGEIKRGPSDWMICCPVHDDSTPSCNVSLDPVKGWYCHACSAKGSIIDLFAHLTGRAAGGSIRFRESVEALGDEFGVPRPQRAAGKSGAPRGKIVATYDYRDEHGTLLYQAVRLDPKDFRQRAPDGDGWTWSLRGVTRRDVPYRLPELLAARAEKAAECIHPPVYACEGEKDCDRLWSLGLLATCNAGGAGKWRSGHSESLPLPCDFVVLADNDDPGRKHAESVCRSLAAAGVRDPMSLVLVELPGLQEHGDVSDWLDAGGTVEQLERIARSAKQWRPQPAAAQQPHPPASSPRSSRRKPPPPVVARAMLDSADPQHHLIYARGELLYYARGCYRSGLAEPIVTSFVRAYLGDDARSGDVSEVLWWLADECRVADSEVDADDAVCVANGLLDPLTGELRPHTPDVRSTVQLAAAWDPEAYHDRADRFLDEVLPDASTRGVCEEFAGYCLLRDCRYERALMLTGNGSNGKSVLLRWLIEMLGAANVSSVGLQEFGAESGRFRTAILAGKLANVFTDLPETAMRESGSFNMLVSGDPLTIERKHKDPVRYANRAKLVFSANKVPRTTDRSDGFFRRWIFVPFEQIYLPPGQIPKRENEHVADPSLTTDLAHPSALSYLLRLAVDGLRRIIARGGIAQTQATAAALHAYRMMSDSMAAWVNEYVVEDAAASTPRRAMYETYCDWCEESKLKPFSAPSFASRLPSFFPGVREVRRRTLGHRSRQWSGVRIIDDDERDASLRVVRDEQTPVLF